MQSAVDRKGFPIAPSNMRWMFRTDERGMDLMTFKRSSVAYLGRILSFRYSQSQTLVVDRTGVSGEFDFNLELPNPRSVQKDDLIRGDAPEDGLGVGIDLESLSPTLEKQLGLKINATKLDLDSMVVDRVFRAPTEN